MSPQAKQKLKKVSSRYGLHSLYVSAILTLAGYVVQLKTITAKNSGRQDQIEISHSDYQDLVLMIADSLANKKIIPENLIPKH
jgi:hypothetical protein